MFQNKVNFTFLNYSKDKKDMKIMNIKMSKGNEKAIG